MTQIEDRSPADIATDTVFARCNGNHTHDCSWHAVMSVEENWYETQGMDPAAEWCKGDPTSNYLTSSALDSIDRACHCEDQR